MTNRPYVPARVPSVAQTQERAVNNVPWWIDWLILIVVVSIGVVGVYTAAQTLDSGVTLSTDTRLSWHLVRAAGLTSYTLLTASTLWGIFLASRVIKDWAPGTLSLILHASASWLGVVLVLVHMGLLLFDSYYSYTLSNLLIPFTGPYRPLWTGLGTIALFLLIGITLSFSFRRLIGQKAWRLLHNLSYVTFALATVHALFSGTDSTSNGMRILLAIFSLVVGVLMLMRLNRWWTNRRTRGAQRLAVSQ